MIEALVTLFNDVMEPNAVTPQEWRTTVIKVLFKDGDPKLPSNYRPISIIPILYKLLSRLIMNRIRSTLDSHQCADQVGFRSGYSTDDHLFTFCQLQEKCKEWRQDLWIAAVDFRKAFDTVSHQKLYQMLREHGVPEIYVNFYEKFYGNQEGCVQLDVLSKKFGFKRGVKQGDPISPIFFNCILEGIFEQLKTTWHSKQYGLTVGTRQLTNLRFADDVLLVGKSLAEVQQILADLAEIAKDHGLALHPGKTKILSSKYNRTAAEQATHTWVLNSKVEILPLHGQTKYLGRLISFHDPHTTEIKHRMKKAWAAFHANKHILCNRSYPLKQRLKVFNAVVTPTAMYGAGSWTLNQTTEAILKRTERQMLRSILQERRQTIPSAAQIANNTDTNTITSTSTTSSSTSTSTASSHPTEHLEPWHTWIQRATRRIEGYSAKWGLEDWVHLAKKRIFNWAGHVSRRHDNRWSTEMLDWTPPRGRLFQEEGQGRRQSRPKTRWEDCLVDYFSTTTTVPLENIC